MPVSDWGDLFQSAGKQYGVDPALLQAIATRESGGDPNAVSPVGAVGPMQLMPDTAKALGVTDPTDPAQAIPAAARLLVQNGKQFGGPEGAVLAYHGGTDQKAWGPKTKAYLTNVTQTYQQLKAAGPMAASSQPANDAFSASLGGAGASAPKTVPAPAPAGPDAFTASLGAPANSNSKVAPPAVTAAPQHPSVMADISAGLTQGARNVVSSIDPIAQWADKHIGQITLGGLLPTADQAHTNNLAARANFNANYGQNIPAQLGQVGGEIATSLPALAAGGELIAPAVSALSKAAPAVAPALNFLIGASKGNKLLQLASKGVAGAAQGAGAAALTSGGSDQPIGQQMQQGAELGGVLGAGVPALSDLGSAIKNRLTGGGISPVKAALADKAINTFGIPLRGSQISNSPFAHYLDSAVGKVPFSGMEAQNEAQRTAFSRAVAGTFGEQADNLTPQVMSNARSRIGDVFNQVAAKTGIADGRGLMTDLGTVLHEASQTLPEGSVTPLEKQVANIGSVIDPQTGTISGEAYQALTRRGSPLDRAMSSSDSNIRHYAGQIKSTLDDALQASAAPEDLAALRQARLQWKNMRTVQDLASKAGIEGEISPALLLGAVKKSYKDMPYSGAGDIGDLAHIGQQFLKEAPSSGTGERLALYSMLGAGSEGAGQLMHDPNALLHTASVLGGVSGVSRLIGYGLKSKMYRDSLLSSVANGQGTLNSAFRSPNALHTIMNNARPYAIPSTVIGANQLFLGGQPEPVGP